jgi:hypothetical protein
MKLLSAENMGGGLLGVLGERGRAPVFNEGEGGAFGEGVGGV